MDITIEMLNERIENLEKQREQLIANVNAVNGAIGTLQQLIKDIKESPEPENEDAADEKR